MQFLGPGGQTYEIEVRKEPTSSRLGGEGWRDFTADNRLIGDGELVCFGLMDGVSTITAIYLNNSGSEEEEEEDEEQEEPPLSPLISQRCKLTAGENEHLQRARMLRGTLWYTHIYIYFCVYICECVTQRHTCIHTEI